MIFFGMQLTLETFSFLLMTGRMKDLESQNVIIERGLHGATILPFA